MFLNCNKKITLYIFVLETIQKLEWKFGRKKNPCRNYGSVFTVISSFPKAPKQKSE